MQREVWGDKGGKAELCRQLGSCVGGGDYRRISVHLVQVTGSTKGETIVYPVLTLFPVLCEVGENKT